MRVWVGTGALIAASVAGGALWLSTRAQPDPERLWVHAEQAFRAGRWDEARAGLRRLENLRSKTARDWLLQAQLASADGRTDLAIEALAHVLETDPLAGQSALMAGRLERSRNRLRAAEVYYRKALTAQPGLIEARRELIYIYGVQLRRHELDAEFRALGNLTPLNHHDLFTWVLTHFSSWRPDIATDLRAYVDADPDDRASRLALVENLLDQPDQEANVLHLLDALPEMDADALALRVSLALHLGRLDEARSLLDRGPPKHPGLAKFRGRLAMLRHDPKAAVEHFRIALSDEPYDRVSYSELARALILDGKAAEAEAYASQSEAAGRGLQAGHPDPFCRQGRRGSRPDHPRLSLRLGQPHGRSPSLVRTRREPRSAGFAGPARTLPALASEAGGRSGSAMTCAMTHIDRRPTRPLLVERTGP